MLTANSVLHEKVNGIFAMSGIPELDLMLATLTPDLRLAAAYAPRAIKHDVIGLLAFDRALSLAVMRASQPIVGQIRLAWWRDFLSETNLRQAVSDSVARTMAQLGHRIALAPHLIAMVNGWETLLEPMPLSEEALVAYAAGRGNGLFAALGSLQARCLPPEAGMGWALVDFAHHCSDFETAAGAMRLGKEAFVDGTLPRVPTILENFARRDAALGHEHGSGAGRPSRLWDALRAAILAK